jgi:flagellar basal body rod protein FlgC
MGLLDIGTSALSAAYQQLQVTGHNISNVNTPGYHRQEAVQSSTAGVMTGAGFFGNGVALTTVKRSYDMFLEREVATSQAQASADTARASQMSNLETLFSDPTTGLSAWMDDLRICRVPPTLAMQPGNGSTPIRGPEPRGFARLAGRRDLGSKLEQIGSDSYRPADPGYRATAQRPAQAACRPEQPDLGEERVGTAARRPASTSATPWSPA